MSNYSQNIIDITSACEGCGTCTKFCTTGSITGTSGREHRIRHSTCVNCGQCLIHCPNHAIKDITMVQAVEEALANASKFVVCQIAPAVRVTLGEEFGMPLGTNVAGKMFAAMRRLGFDGVFDTQFTADLTIMEEGSELIERITKNRGPLPQFTSCCPAWIKHAEVNYPGLLKNLSSAKSPQQMFGSIAKTYGAGKLSVSPDSMFVVSVMPCTAKKFECQRPEMDSSGYTDVDVVVTTRELAQMIKAAGIDFNTLLDEQPDSIMGASSGAATIFGATGGVMEAAVRTAYYLLTGNELIPPEFTPVRGFEAVREASVDVAGTTLRLAIVSGLKAADTIAKSVLAGSSPYHFIEVMNCPGGCVNGGGQPVYSLN